MPRQPDPDLEGRILAAARKLWKKGADAAFTMRAVAQAAGTNTPAVYRRFQSREDILRALLRRIQQEVGSALRPCQSPEEMCETYLDYALRHPHEYELFYEHAYQLPHPRPGHSVPLRESRPAMALVEAKLAERLGGSPGDHTRLALALWTVTHGTSMILVSKAIPEEHAPELRSVFTAAVDVMIRTAGRGGFGVTKKRGDTRG
jgi:AcrR family transcriptional regulator